MPSPCEAKHRPMRAEHLNRSTLLEDFMKYGRPASDFLIGGEFERAVVRADGTPVRYDDPDGIRWILEQLRDRQPGWKEVREDQNLIALVRPNAANITLEPGGQGELSGAPPHLGEVAAELHENRTALLQLAEGRDLHWTACGLTPIAPISTIGWMPKGRYAIMREYLPNGATSPCG